jgi:tetratricopeptide (TPR) repeat protein
MSVTFDDSFRQVVPRWLDYASSCSLGLLRIVNKKMNDEFEIFPNPRIEFDWENDPNLFSAIELVAEAVILKTFESLKAKEAARFILKNASNSSLLVLELARHFLEETNNKNDFVSPGRGEWEDRSLIKSLKKTIRTHLNNPIAWSDMALLYAVLGQGKKCRRAMQFAIALGKQNRFVLRSASRCFLHIEEPEYAIKILRDSEMCGIDPWVTSAEIALSEWMNISSSFVKVGQQLVKNSNLSPFSLSELLACLSTLEIKNGALKKGKALLRDVLIDPSENALAQVEWITKLIHTEIQTDIPIPASYEAQARHHLRKKEFLESLNATKKWAKFQPFSSRPLISASFIASACLNDDAQAISIIESSANTHRKNSMLINNLAFCYARQNNIEQATEALSNLCFANLNDCEKFTIEATRGLIYFRSGEIEKGRELYRNSINSFEKIKEINSAAIGTYFWALEEKRLGSKEATERIIDAKKKIKKSSIFELFDLVDAL